MLSGTVRPPGPCQPALSGTRTMMRSRSAPVSSANLASSASKNGFETPVETVLVRSPDLDRTAGMLGRRRGFFQRLLFFQRRRLRMPRPRHLDRPLQFLQGVPAALRVDRLATEADGDPCRHFRPRPEPAVVRRLPQPLGQRRQNLRHENRRRPPVVPANIRTTGVVSRDQQLDPARHEPQDFRNSPIDRPFAISQIVR
jgi:hypothetical protein